MRTTSTQQPFTAAEAVLMPNSVPSSTARSFKAIHNDFIHHPERFPLNYRRTSLWQRHFGSFQGSETGDLGLTFKSKEYIAAGTDMEISIPLRGVIQKFRGTVVLVREIADGYEIGLWFSSEDDASRARIVEQICHIECYLDEKHQRQGGEVRPSREWPQQLTRPFAS